LGALCGLDDYYATCTLVIMTIVGQAKLEETFFLVVTDMLMVICWLRFALTAAPFSL